MANEFSFAYSSNLC